MRMNSIKQGDEQISEEESKRKRHYVAFLPALDLAFISKVQNLSPDHVLEKTQMKVGERNKLIDEDLQQSFPLKGN